MIRWYWFAGTKDEWIEYYVRALTRTRCECDRDNGAQQVLIIGENGSESKKTFEGCVVYVTRCGGARQRRDVSAAVAATGRSRRRRRVFGGDRRRNGPRLCERSSRWHRVTTCRQQVHGDGHVRRERARARARAQLQSHDRNARVQRRSVENGARYPKQKNAVNRTR